MARAIVIFGAAVWRGGQPSPSLRRRVAYGAAAAHADPDDMVFCSGGVGRFGPSEASLMAQLLAQAGIDPARIVLDEASLDTLQNVVAASRFIRAEGLDGALVCTDRYHLPRVRMLFAALGVASEPGPVAPGRGDAPLSYWLSMNARELAAYPYDLAVVLRRGAELRRHVAGPGGTPGRAAR
jgi:uncharacterized SAM-binding protein YcdF (DUF218 family)